jgi:hypothetical protein
MQHFIAQFWDADHAVFDRVAGIVDCPAEASLAGATGQFEVPPGGIPGAGADLATDREYRLALEDGRSWAVWLTRIPASSPAGLARIEFRIADDPIAETQPGMAGS